jgi:hypothetical protein
MVCSGFLAEIERIDLDKLRERHREAFERPYDPGAGLMVERAL